MQEFKKLLKEYINEISIENVGGKDRISSNDGKNFVVKPGNSPWIKKLTPDLSCFSVYRVVKTPTDSLDPIDLIKVLKDPKGDHDVELLKGVIDEILNKGVEICEPWLQNLEFDLIATPQSSKTLSIRFARKISERLNKELLPSAILKNLPDAKLSSDLPSSYSQKSIKNLHRNLERMKVSPEQNIHKYFRPQDRKYLTNWQKIRGEENIKKDSNVILVDDVITDGSTFIEMKRVLESVGMKVVGCVTLFRTGS
jgi:hypothetical protein